MPIYEYQCKNCEHCEDVLKPLSKIDSSEICPKCQTEMHKILSGNYKINQKGYCYNNSESGKYKRFT